MITFNIIESALDVNNLLIDACSTSECAIDTETTGLRWSLGHQPFMATFSPDENTSYACYAPRLVNKILTAFDVCNINFIFHNASFDLHMLEAWSACKWRSSRGYPALRIHDTMHASRLQRPGESAALKSISKQFAIMDDLDVDGPQKAVQNWIIANTKTEKIAGKAVKIEPGYNDVPQELMLPYACQDTILTLRLHHAFADERLVTEKPSRLLANTPNIDEVYKAELACVKVCVEIERRGFPVNADALRAAILRANAAYAEAVQEWEATPYGTILPTSPTALRRLLYAEIEFLGNLGEPTKHRTAPSKTSPSGQPGTDEMSLKDCETIEGKRVAAIILKMRGWKKHLERLLEIQSFLAPDGRVHTSLKGDAARTGRFSSSEPALQNLSRPDPKKEWTMARAIFQPEAGKEFLLADFSQIELRIAAHYMNDLDMIATLSTGGDLHRDTAAAMYGIDPSVVKKSQRSIAKILNFAVLYGAGLRRVTEMLRYGAPGTDALTIAEVKEALALFGALFPETEIECFTMLAGLLLDAFHTKRPKVRQFLNAASTNAKRYKCVYTAFGLRIPIPPPTYSPVYKKFVSYDHKAGNGIIQGTAAGIMKETIIRSEVLCTEYCAKTQLKMWDDIEIIMTIHDELIFQTPIGHAEPLAAFMDPELSRWPQFNIPIMLEYAKVENGSNWAYKKEFLLPVSV